MYEAISNHFNLKIIYRLFLNCFIPYLIFKSQMNEYMKEPKKGNRKKFIRSLSKSNIVESIIRKLTNKPELLRAKYAGTEKSNEWSLILCEGQTAANLVISALSPNQKNYYRAFALCGRNIKKEEIIKILNLPKKNLTEEDISKLTYGKIMIMSDQDPNGSHISSLVIKFFKRCYPAILHLSLIDIFMTPIVKAIYKDDEVPFFHYQSLRRG